MNDTPSKKSLGIMNYPEINSSENAMQGRFIIGATATAPVKTQQRGDKGFIALEMLFQWR